MKTPIYKKYNILYKGGFLEQISATSKKNVQEYIVDEYKGKSITNSYLNYIWGEKYIMKEFKILLNTKAFEYEREGAKREMFGDEKTY